MTPTIKGEMKFSQEQLDTMKDIILDHINRAYDGFKVGYFSPTEMWVDGVVADRILEEIQKKLEAKE